MAEFDGLVAIVTGGASGIGAAAADLLFRQGARVAVLDRQVSTDARMLAQVCDVTRTDEVSAAVDAVAAEFGRIDVLVNNAGIGAIGDITENDDAEWLRVLDINVIGVARVSRAALPHLRRSPAAAIVNTCSVVAEIGVPLRALYSASKGAVAALTRAMAADHIRDPVRVNAVLPGTAETPWIGRLLDAADDADVARAQLQQRQPLGRLVSADEVAHAISYLASPSSGSTTGALLTVDGGMGSLRV
jgi:NAD(P)-dependent dehydrogenase (short-subunit alcohol dehydrogenase family)